MQNPKSFIWLALKTMDQKDSQVDQVSFSFTHKGNQAEFTWKHLLGKIS